MHNANLKARISRAKVAVTTHALSDVTAFLKAAASSILKSLIIKISLCDNDVCSLYVSLPKVASFKETRQFVLLSYDIKKVKTVHEPSGSLDRSLSRFP